MHQIISTLDLERPRAEVFDYLARPANLLVVALPETHLELVEGPDRLHAGARTTWKARRWGLSRLVTLEVTVFEENARVVEEQRAGPFGCWVQTQEFTESTHGMRLVTSIDFEPPSGMLGRLLTVTILEKEIRSSLEHRARFLGAGPMNSALTAVIPATT